MYINITNDTAEHITKQTLTEMMYNMHDRYPMLDGERAEISDRTTRAILQVLKYMCTELEYKNLQVEF